MMKQCPKCGNDNDDEFKFCQYCGCQLTQDSTAGNSTQSVPNSNELNYDNTQYNNNQYPSYQQNTYPKAQKNQYVAPVLNLIGGLILYILCGIGHFYLGLNKRGLVFCVLGFIPMIANVLLGNLASLLVGLIIVIYAIYDAYICTQAINEGRSIPLLFNSLEVE